jgi:hypothetical protein
MVVLRFTFELRFVEERRTELIGFGEEVVDGVAVERIRNDEIADVGE